MKDTSSLTLVAAFAVILGASPAQAQSHRIVSATADGQTISIPLTQEDQGRDILVRAESSKPSAQAFTVTIAAVDGISAQLSGAVIDSNVGVTANALDAELQPLTIRDSRGNVKEKIELPGASGGGGGTCLEENPDLTPEQLDLFRLVYPGKSDDEICRLIFPPSDTPKVPSASGTGIIFRSACSKDQKIVAQARISTAGVRSSDFEGTKSIQVRISLESDDSARNYIRTKVAEGREKGASYYMSPTLNPVFFDKYGVSGSDELVIQLHNRSGELQSSSKNLVRPFFSNKRDRGYSINQMNISNISAYMRNRSRTLSKIRQGALRETFTTVNYKVGKVYSVCMPAKPKIIGLCTGGYTRAFKISCRGF